eukprot:scaffold103759_cov25-Tisochrysis_lutea.AAC.1
MSCGHGCAYGCVLDPSLALICWANFGQGVVTAIAVFLRERPMCFRPDDLPSHPFMPRSGTGCA